MVCHQRWHTNKNNINTLENAKQQQEPEDKTKSARSIKPSLIDLHTEI